MNLENLINTSSAGGGIILTIIAGMIILLPILIIIAIFNISSNSTKLTKQMELLNKQMDYLLQLEERKQGINQNPSQNVQQNIPKILTVADLTQDNKRNNQRKSEILRFAIGRYPSAAHISRLHRLYYYQKRVDLSMLRMVIVQFRRQYAQEPERRKSQKSE